MRRRTTIHTLALTAAFAALPLTAACSAAQKALDCGELALNITADAQELSQALANAGDNPRAAAGALERIERDMDKLSKKTSDSDVQKAVGKLADRVRDTNDALDAGRIPSGKPVTDAAADVAAVCSPG